MIRQPFRSIQTCRSSFSIFRTSNCRCFNSRHSKKIAFHRSKLPILNKIISPIYSLFQSQRPEPSTSEKTEVKVAKKATPMIKLADSIFTNKKIVVFGPNKEDLQKEFNSDQFSLPYNRHNPHYLTENVRGFCWTVPTLLPGGKKRPNPDNDKKWVADKSDP